MGKVKNTPTSLNYANRPEKIDKPEKHDDLKLISDIGSKSEAMLHELGIYTYAQVAGWIGAQREWVVGYLNLKGGIDCDDWVRQAEVLTRNIEADYIRFFSKKPR